ncbi:MAG: histidinol-phosphate transaminase, partial [Alphaproteobacteria bacterium]|nr:histidinol-phosphate transaminase [Alphaproteobacteria bacterium]
MDNIICGNGSDEILSLFANCFAGEGDEIVYSEHGFLVYPIATKAAGATPVVAKEKKYKADVEEIINVCTNKTKVCFIANPNNPTGTYLNRNQLITLRKKLPKSCLLVIDSAYAEYVEKDDYTNGFELVNKFNNVACTRTFSKIYGLAALRI